MIKAAAGSPYRTLLIASDHAGVEMKAHLIGRFPFLPWRDLGPQSTESVDYPEFAARLGVELEPLLPEAIGVLICGSGQGMAIRANRFPFVRAALCWSPEVAKVSREHNDANVLCLAARFTEPAHAELIFQEFLATPFAGGRHQRRVDKLNR